MKLNREEMRIIREALEIAHSKYDIDVQVAMHNYEENAAELIHRKAAIESLMDKLGRRYE